jgi:catechol 2,3-dioxygenase-like lactoylglutathione lyase family enzyme
MLRGVFLTSDSPEATARFYEQVAALPLERVGVEGQYVYWRIDQGDMQLAIHDARAFAAYAYPPEAASNLTHLYFKIDDQQAFLDHLEALGVAPLAKDEVVISVVDPDGRKVMFGTA